MPLAQSRPVLLGSRYLPSHKENRMKNEGDVEYARKLFYDGVNPNLVFLLNHRFLWMQKFIDPEKSCGVEVGCGQGYGKDVLQAKSYLLTDYAEYEWLDVKHVDALNTPFEDNAFDFVVAANMIHHVPFPRIFFEEMQRILKVGGRILVQDVNCSLLMRAMLHLMRIEGYSYDVDVFDRTTPVNDAKDLWSGNNAVPNMLFDDENRFHREIPFFQIIDRGYGEVSVYLASGGVTAKAFFIPLPRWLLQALKWIDDGVVALAPQIFALQRRIVLERIA